MTLHHSQKGLTLLEIMIALVILAIALTAVIKTTSENIRTTAYLQEKTSATWLGLNILHQVQLGLISFPGAPEHREGRAQQLNQDWEWQGHTQNTANGRILELHVQVFHLPDHHLITELTTYAYAV